LFNTQLGYLLAAGFILAVGWDVPYGWRQAHLPPGPQTLDAWSKQLQSLLRLSKRETADAKKWIEQLAKQATGDATKPPSLINDIQTLAEQIGVRKWSLSNPDDRIRFGTIARFSQILQSFERARLTGRWVNDAGNVEFKGASGDRGHWFYLQLARFARRAGF